MKFSRTTLSAALLAAGVSGAANAELLLPSQDVQNQGGSELVFTLFDRDTGESYSRDLGFDFNDAGVNLGSQAIDLTTDALFNTVFDNPVQNLVWGIVAADSVFTGDLNTIANTPEELAKWGKRMLTTSDAQIAPGSLSNKKLSDAVATSFFNNVAVAGSHPTQEDGSSLVLAGFASWDDSSNMESWGGNVNFNTEGGVGESLQYNLLEQVTHFVPSPLPPIIPDDIGVENNDPAKLTVLGTWLLDSAGQLTYTAPVSQVPLPAGVWLFGSALAGLVGVSRRRRAG